MTEFRRRIREEGWVRALKIGILHAESILFDLRHGTDTFRRVPLRKLCINSEPRSRAAPYDASPVWPLRHLLRKFGVSGSDVFVDFGCGKGRALLVAAGFPFRRVVGIEFS